VYDTVPEKARYYAYDTTPKRSEGRVLVSQAYLMLNLLQNRFLVDRVAIARGFPKEQRLLDTALETVDLVNMFWIKRDQLMIYCFSFDWIVSFCSFLSLRLHYNKGYNSSHALESQPRVFYVWSY
jgi:hypothetical protein